MRPAQAAPAPAPLRRCAAFARQRRRRSFDSASVPPQPALGEQHRDLRGGSASRVPPAGDQHMREPGRQRERGDRACHAAVEPPLGIERAERGEARPRLRSPRRRAADRASASARGSATPQRAVEQQRGQVGFQYFRRVEARQRRRSPLLPTADRRDARPLARGAAGALGRRAWLARSVTRRVIPAARS